MSEQVRTDEPRPDQIAAITGLLALAYLPLSTHLALQVSALVAGLVLLRLATLRWPRLSPGRWLLFPLTLAGAVNVYQAYHTLAGQEGGTALLATMLALKLVETRTLREIRFGTILFGVLLIVQFLFDQSPGLALYLGALLIADMALMIDVNFRTASRPLVSALRIAGRLTLQALPLALILFVLFPRLSAPLWSLGRAEGEARSGMSDWMEPGMVSDLVLSGEPAFRVRFDGPRPDADALYWRGPVLWYTDGRRWEPADQGILPSAPAAAARLEDRIAYAITMEPSGQPWLFPLDLPVAAPPGTRLAADFQLVAGEKINSVKRFQLVSALRYNTGELDPEQEFTALQLPENVSPRMRAQVQAWQAEASTAADLVRLALAFINREPFYYTLQPPRLGENPADEFLFETRRGFCEHYASSFALLMRLAGIPSRVVVGYLGGEPNPIGDYLIVRQSDAHAWVEVWLEDQGWIRVDPTAAVAPERIERFDALDRLASGAPVRFRLDESAMLVRWVHNLRLLADGLDAGWRDWVLGYSSERQHRLLQTFGLGFLRQYGLALAMMISVSIVLAVLVMGLLRSDHQRDPLQNIYARFCRKLKRAGFERGPGEGPADFARRVVIRRPELRPSVDAFLALYLPLRYGQRRDRNGLRELEQRLADVRPGHARLQKATNPDGK
jgi:transglutaminase-like putative cysteine protease